MEYPAFMEEDECLCVERVWALTTRIRYMEHLLDSVLERLETEQHLASNSPFSSSASETDFLGQSGLTPAVALHEMAEQGDVLALVQALCKGADPAATDLSGDTALHCAVCSGNTLAVELLLAAGAPVDAQDIRGATPLAVAACRGQHDMVEVLLEKGASIDKPDNDGRTPLMRAVVLRNVKIAVLLVQKGASVNVVDRNGDSPLVTASRDCLMDILAVLMHSKPFVAQIQRAMSVAGSPAVFLVLMEDAPIAAMCSIKTTLLSRVAKQGWERPVRALLANCWNRHCRSSEHYKNVCQALAVASTESILLALWSSAPAATRKTALRCSAYRGWGTALGMILQHWRNSGRIHDRNHLAEIDEALRVTGSEAVAMQLLTEHVNPAKTLVSREVLWRAAQRGWPTVLLLLINNGAPADPVRCDGTTLLHCASARGHVNCVKTLIKKGALTSRTDDDGWTPLHLAAEGGHEHVVEALLALGADPSVKDPFGLTPCDVASSSIVGEILKIRGKPLG